MNSYLRYREIYGKPTILFPHSGFSKLVVSDSFEEDSTPLACRFNPDPRYSNIFAICNEVGDLRFGNTDLIQCPPVRKTSNGTGEFSPQVDVIQKDFKVDENMIFDCQWRPSYSNQIWAASGSRTVSLWDVERRAEVTKYKDIHTCSVRCLSVCPEEPFLCASGSRDGSIMLWDLRDNDKSKAKRTIRNAHGWIGNASSAPKPKRARTSTTPKLQPESITALLLCSKNTVVSGGTKPKGIRFWDLRKSRANRPNSEPIPYRTVPPDAENATAKENAGFSSFCTEPNSGNNLYATCTDDIIYSYSLWSSTEPVKTYEGATISTYYAQAAVCPNLPYMICGSRKHGGMIWSLDTQQPLHCLHNNRLKDVTAVAWNDRFEILVFYDKYYRLFKLNPEASESTRMCRALKNI